MKRSKGFKDMVEAIKKEEQAKAKVEAYRDIAKKHPGSITAEIEADLNLAIETAKKAQKAAIKQVVVMEMEECAAFEGCSHPELLSQCLSEHIQVNEKGEVKVIDPQTGLPQYDRTTGRILEPSSLVKDAQRNSKYSPLFRNDLIINKATTKTAAISTEGMKNPWKKGTLNLTMQAKILTENPTLAEQLQQEART